ALSLETKHNDHRPRRIVRRRGHRGQRAHRPGNLLVAHAPLRSPRQQRHHEGQGEGQKLQVQKEGWRKVRTARHFVARKSYFMPRPSGFTLIEVVISASLMALVLVAAYVCLSAGFASKKLVEPRADIIQNA